MRTWILLPLALLFGQAEAQTLYKCKGANGVTAYQEKPCSESSTTLEERDLPQTENTQPKRPVKTQHQYYFANGQPIDPSLKVIPNYPVPAGPKAPPQQPAAPRKPLLTIPGAVTYTPNAQHQKSPDHVGYQCDDGGRRWTQKTPCPDMRTLFGHDRRGRRSAATVRVNQEELTKKGLCSGKQSIGSSGNNTYEKKKYGC